MKIVFKIAEQQADFELGRELFQEYAASLGVDLSFQNFEWELQSLQFQYNRPGGALILVFDDQHPAGCAGIREYEAETAELKRMYIRQQYRGHHIGRLLLEQVLDAVKELGYQKIRLDSMPDMKAALELYKSYGFREIPPYRFNPVKGAVYMEKILNPRPGKKSGRRR